MPAAKPLSKADILNAQANTRSNRAASRYLNCSYTHYKRYAKLYKDDETGKSLFEKHLNPSGKGIPKFISGYGMDKFPILDIIEGRVSSDHFEPNKIKDAMIKEGMIREQCANCGFNERRVIDFRMPLLMYFKDGNKKNYYPDNLKLYCYNCYYLTIGDVFTPKQEQKIQDHKSIIQNGEFDWELDEYQKEILDNITSKNNNPPSLDDDGPYSLVSRK